MKCFVKRKEDFTLIELLIVVGVIAILAALLLPALTKSLDRASGIECRNNLKQLGTANAMYVNDSKDYLPMSKDSKGLTWDRKLVPYLNYNVDDADTKSITDNWKIFSCPLDTITRQNNASIRSFCSNPTVYATNSWGESWSRSRKISQIMNPTSRFMLYDLHCEWNCLMKANYEVCGSGGITEGGSGSIKTHFDGLKADAYVRVHDKQANICFVGGNVNSARTITQENWWPGKTMPGEPKN